MWDEPEQPPTPRYPERTQAFGGGYPPNAPGGQGAGYDSYDAEGTYTQPYPGAQQAYTPQPPAYPGGRPPQWPAQQYAPPAYPEQPPAYAPEPVAPPRPARTAAYAAPARRSERSGRGVSLPHLPIAHVFLIAGVAAMAYAIGQQWGVDSHGAQIFVRDFQSARIQHTTGVDTGALAVRTATVIVGAAAVLSAALILFNLVLTILNKILSIIGLGGIATLIFFPVLWGAATLLFVVLLGAAGFAGLGALSSLPVVQNHAFSVLSIKQYSLGFYLWSGGAVAVFIGMLGQLVLRRR